MPNEPDILDDLLGGDAADGGRMQEEQVPAIQI